MMNGEKTDQDIERRCANGISASEISDLDRLRFYRDEVKHEFNLLGMRSTMLVSCQSFLIVPFAILNTVANFRTVLAAEYLIASLGIFFARILAEPINAAHRAEEKWLLKQRSLQQQSESIRDLSIDRDLIPGAATDLREARDHARSLAFPRFAPTVFIIFWAAYSGRRPQFSAHSGP